MKRENTYKERVNMQKERLGYSNRETLERLKESLKKNMPSMEATDSQLMAWSVSPAVGRQTRPSLAVLPLVADVLQTNVGYLLALHDVHEMKNPRVTADIDIVKCNARYKNTHGKRSIWQDRIMNHETYLRIKENGIAGSRPQPLINLSEALSWDIDYILGLTDVKHWQYWCMDSGKLSYLPDETRFLLDDGKTIVTLKNGTFFVLKDGIPLKMDLQDLKRKSVGIIRGYELLD